MCPPFAMLVQRQGAARAPTGDCSGSDSDWEDDFDLAAPSDKRRGGSGSGRPAPNAAGHGRQPLKAAPASKEQQQQQQQPAAAAKRKQPAAAAKQKQPAAAAAKQKQPAAAAAAAAAKQKRALAPAPSNSNQPAATAKKPRAPPRQKQQHPQQHLQQQRQHPPRASESSDEDEFVAGTLVQAPVRQQAREPQPPPAAAPGSGKQQQQQQGQGQQQGQQQQGQQQAGAFGPGVGVIRLDRLAADRWPGWQASMQGVARVAPYQPAPASPPVLMPAGDGGGRGAPLAALALAPAGEGGRLELVPDLLRYDLTRLGGGFQAVLLNAGPASLARLAAGDWRLPRAALASGLLFVWAAKAQVAAGVRLMAASGFAYVENLTHVLLGPDGHPLQDPSALFNRSHATLLFGRRSSSEHLELRHQRTPDVIASPALPDGCCPPAVYAAIETMLPDASGPRAGGRLRLLELAFMPAGGGGGEAAPRRCRPRWLTLLQRGWPDDA